MPVTNEKFDQLKIDRLKHFLIEMAAKGQPRPFEIFVDSLKVVPKTEDPKEFDNYEFYMNEDTEKLRILIYNSQNTPRNDQYCYFLQTVKTEKSLNGLEGLDGIIQEKLAARDREHETRILKAELEETKKQLEEAEEYVEKLEAELELSKSNKYKLGRVDLVELGGAWLERVMQKNAPVLEKAGLGFITPQGENETTPEQPTVASFQKKPQDLSTDNGADTGAGIPAEHLQYLPLLHHMNSIFEPPEMETTMKILGKLADDPSQLPTIAGLLNIQPS